MNGGLDPIRWAEVERLVLAALEYPVEERAAFLERECPDDAIRQEAVSLAAHAGKEVLALQTAIAAAAAMISSEPTADEKLIGTRVGAYRIEAIAGYGGMGAVYRASRDDLEFYQQVAIKLVRVAVQSADSLQRFRRERQILASLAHPNIARLLDGGSTTDGVPYLVMEYIEGEAITVWCHRQSPSIEQRLRLFLQVCEGVESAHERMIVHRDLKPGNILVTAEGTVKLLDFGIARMLEPDAGDASAATATALGRAMTPEYAAPEQVRGDPVSKPGDVYALGLILYEILTGKRAQTVPDSSPGTLVRVVCHTEPVAPAVLDPSLAGDLDNIIRMAIRKEPERRYASAADLARDIRLYLESRPVTARPDTAAYRTTRFLRRNRAVVTAASVTAMVFGLVALVYVLSRPGKSPRALRVTQLTQSGHAIPEDGLATDGSYVYFMDGSPRQRLVRVPVDGGAPQSVFDSLEKASILDISPDRSRLLLGSGASDEAGLWEAATNGSELRRIGDASGHTAAWSPDGKNIAVGRGTELFLMNSDGSGLRRLRDMQSRFSQVRWGTSQGALVLRLTVRSPDGHAGVLWQVESNGANAHPLLTNWDSASPHSDDYGNWILGGKYYLFRSFSGSTYSLWTIGEGHPFFGSTETRPALIHSTPSRIDSLTPSSDGKSIFFVSSQQRNHLVKYDTTRSEFIPYLPEISAKGIGFSRDGRWVAYATSSPPSIWRSRPDGSQAQKLFPASMRVYNPDWSPDGAWIVFNGFPAQQPYGVYVVPSTGGIPQRLSPPGSADIGPSWSGDGKSVIFYHKAASGSAETDGFYQIDWRTRQMSPLPESKRWVRGAWSPDGQYIAVADGTQIYLIETQTQRLKHLASAKAIQALLWSRSGRYVFYQDALEADQPIFRVSLDGGKKEWVTSAKQIPQSDLSQYSLAALAPDDTLIVTVSRHNSDIYSLELELP